MKRTKLAILVAITLLTFSCKKASNSGYWSFKGINYNVGVSYYGNNTGTIYARTDNQIANIGGVPQLQCRGISNLLFYRHDSAIVASNPTGIDTVSVFLQLERSPNSTYTSTGNSHQRIYIKHDQGNVYISGFGIELQNDSNPSDKGILNLGINATE